MIELEKFQSGHWEQVVGYTCFVPRTVNEEWTWKTAMVSQLLEKAALRLGELNAFARLVPNIDLFIQLHVAKEAVVSSRIEGTSTSMEEAVMPMEEVQPEHRNDWKEVRNYIQALNGAIDELGTLPVSSRLLKKTHKTLLQSVRGDTKQPGEYRTSQNWIGGCGLSDARFIPPHPGMVHELMGDLESFLNNKRIRVPSLVRIAIAHYQFETIHPFLDGNGRMGRLLVTLYLVSEGILDQPLLYLSAWFERDKSLYYDNLSRVRTHSDMVHWLVYFLTGIEQTAAKAVKTLTGILALKENVERDIQTSYGRRSQKALLLLQSLFRHPVTTVDQASGICDLSFKAANDLIHRLQMDGYLKEITGQSRNRTFLFEKYLDEFSRE